MFLVIADILFVLSHLQWWYSELWKKRVWSDQFDWELVRVFFYCIIYQKSKLNKVRLIFCTEENGVSERGWLDQLVWKLVCVFFSLYYLSIR